MARQSFDDLRDVILVSDERRGALLRCRISGDRCDRLRPLVGDRQEDSILVSSDRGACLSRAGERRPRRPFSFQIMD
jgi:hypothetical protein